MSNFVWRKGSYIYFIMIIDVIDGGWRSDILLVWNHSSQYDNLLSTGHTSPLNWYVKMRVRICIVYLRYSKLTRKYLHLLRRWLAAESSTKGVGLERSSKLMMYRQMSSTSLLTGAITSLHRNFVPETWLTVYYYIRSINQINVYKLICISKVVGAHR